MDVVSYKQTRIFPFLLFVFSAPLGSLCFLTLLQLGWENIAVFIMALMFLFLIICSVYGFVRPLRLDIYSDRFVINNGLLGSRTIAWGELDNFFIVYRNPFLAEVAWVCNGTARKCTYRMIGYGGVIPFGIYFSASKFMDVMNLHLKKYRESIHGSDG